MNNFKILDSLSEISASLERNINVDEESLRHDLEKNHVNPQSPIFIFFSAIGGILTVLFFLFFVYLSKINESSWACLAIGIAMLVGSVYLSLRSDGIYLESVASACLMGGLFLLAYAMNEFKLHEYIITGIILILCVLISSRVKDFSVLLFAFLVILGCLVYYLVDIFKDNVVFFLMASFALLFSWAIYKEAQWYVQWKRKSYILQAYILALYIGVFSSLIYYFMELKFENPQLFIITSIILLLLSVTNFYFWSSHFIISYNLRIVYSIVLVLILLPFYNYPVVPGFFMLILHCFYSNRKWLLILSSMGLIFSLSRFYYDLEWTLLSKSMVLMASGILFLMALLLHQKYFQYGKNA